MLPLLVVRGRVGGARARTARRGGIRTPVPIPHASQHALRVHGAERHPPGRRGRSLCLDVGAWGMLSARARGLRDMATRSAPPGRETSPVSTAFFQGENGRRYCTTSVLRHKSPQDVGFSHHWFVRSARVRGRLAALCFARTRMCDMSLCCAHAGSRLGRSPQPSSST